METKLPYHNLLNKKPDDVRYLWSVVTTDKEYSGYTWGSLHKVLKENTDCLVRMIDLVDNIVIIIENPEELMTAWRANYYDSNWELKKENL